MIKYLLNIKIRSLIIIFIIFLQNISSYGALVDFNESNVIFEKIEKKILLNDDFSYEEITEIIKEYHNVPSDDDAKKYEIFSFNPSCELIEIISIKNINEFVVYEISQNDLEKINNQIKEQIKKYKNTSNYNYDINLRIQVNYPLAKKNSTYILEYRVLKIKPVIKDFFSYFDFIGLNQKINNYRLKIYYPKKLDLFYKINDPNNKIIIYNSLNNFVNYLDIRTKDHISPVLNDKNFNIDIEEKTIIQISSDNNYRKIIDNFNKNFPLENQNLKLPIFQKIITQAKKIDNYEDQIKFVISEIKKLVNFSDKFYLIQGEIQHKKLYNDNLIIFDIKDLAYNTSLILRKLGIDAYPLFTKKDFIGERYQDNNLISLPNINYFNYAIVRIRLKNFQTPLDIDLVEDYISLGFKNDNISSRDAIILNNKINALRYITHNDPSVSQLKQKDIISLGENYENILTRIKLKGTFLITLINLLKNKENIFEREIFSKYILMKDIERYLQYESNIDLNEKFQEEAKMLTQYLYYNSKNQGNNNSYILEFSYPVIFNLITKYDEKKSSFIYFGNPTTIEKERIFKNKSLKNPSIYNVQVNSDWLSFYRYAENTKIGISFKDIIVIRRSFIPKKDLKTKEFKTFQENLKKYGIVIVDF